MRSTTIFAVLYGTVAFGSPLAKRAIVTHVMTRYVTVWIPPNSTPAAHNPIPHSAVVVKPTAAPKPAPQPAAAKPASAPQGSKPTLPQPNGSSFTDIVLYQHNVHRVNHSSPSVTYNNVIAGYAAKVAGTCHYGHDITPGGGGYGQNIAVYGTTANARGIGASASVAKAIGDMWYNGEVGIYPWQDANEPTPDMSDFENWGHFSQIVWKGTASVGCASQFCDKGTIFKDLGAWFTVCNYYPAGNVGGGYSSNVHKPEGAKTIPGS